MRTDGKPVGKAMTMPFSIIEVSTRVISSGLMCGMRSVIRSLVRLAVLWQQLLTVYNSLALPPRLSTKRATFNDSMLYHAVLREQYHHPHTTHAASQVKLKCAGDALDMPLWLEALLTQSVRAAKVKISKYNFGCAMLLTPLCRTFPAWISFAQNPFEGEPPPPSPASFRFVLGYLVKVVSGTIHTYAIYLFEV